MNDDLNDVENKTVKPIHFLAAVLGGAFSIPLTIRTPTSVTVHGIYLGLPVILFWVAKAFDLNPMRSLLRGRWLLLAAVLACAARELTRGTSGDAFDHLHFIRPFLP